MKSSSKILYNVNDNNVSRSLSCSFVLVVFLDRYLYFALIILKIATQKQIGDDDEEQNSEPVNCIVFIVFGK